VFSNYGPGVRIVAFSSKGTVLNKRNNHHAVIGKQAGNARLVGLQLFIGTENPKTGVVTIETVKKLAAYHQYYAVNRAVESTLRATGHTLEKQTPVSQVMEDPASYGVAGVKNQPKGDRKGGVVWHTQGSGKSLSMVFFTGKIVLALDWVR
jgi:hypothetical protein